jgi:hypothetical protein
VIDMDRSGRYGVNDENPGQKLHLDRDLYCTTPQGRNMLHTLIKRDEKIFLMPAGG